GNRNQAGNGNAVAIAYGVGTTGGNSYANFLTGLPLNRQVEFQIDLIPGAAPVARAPSISSVQNEGIVGSTIGTF
nr:putative reverse transcriptase domain-containing protein [Tanacetum cinerariifolium]